MDKNHLIEILRNGNVSAQLRKCKNPKEVYELLKDKVDMSFDEFTKVMTEIKDEYSDEENSLLQKSDVQNVLKSCNASETTATTVTTITASASAADY